MNCTNFRQQLEALLDGRAVEPDALRAHAQQCADCARQLALEQGFRAGLRELVNDTDFDPQRSERLLGPLRQRHRTGFRRGLGVGAVSVAASLMLGVVIGMMIAAPAPEGAAPTAVERIVALDPMRDDPVRMVFRSPSDLQGARIHLVASEGVELRGYPDQRELSWSTDLRAGANLLELPVMLRGTEGTLVATITHGEGSRSFTIHLQPKAGPGAGLHGEPLTGMGSQGEGVPHA